MNPNLEGNCDLTFLSILWLQPFALAIQPILFYGQEHSELPLAQS